MQLSLLLLVSYSTWKTWYDTLRHDERAPTSTAAKERPCSCASTRQGRPIPEHQPNVQIPMQ